MIKRIKVNENYNLGSDETRVMHTRSVCEEFMSGRETEEIVEKLFRCL